MAKITVEIKKDGEHCKPDCPMILMRRIQGLAVLYCRLFASDLGSIKGRLEIDSGGILREAECINQAV